jgi:hypothetical protein
MRALYRECAEAASSRASKAYKRCSGSVIVREIGKPMRRSLGAPIDTRSAGTVSAPAPRSSSPMATRSPPGRSVALMPEWYPHRRGAARIDPVRAADSRARPVSASRQSGIPRRARLTARRKPGRRRREMVMPGQEGPGSGGRALQRPVGALALARALHLCSARTELAARRESHLCSAPRRPRLWRAPLSAALGRASTPPRVIPTPAYPVNPARNPRSPSQIGHSPTATDKRVIFHVWKLRLLESRHNHPGRSPP